MRAICVVLGVFLMWPLVCAQEDYCPEAGSFYNASQIESALREYRICRTYHWNARDYDNYFSSYWMVLDCISKRQETRALLTELDQLREREEYVPEGLKAANAHVIKQFEFLLNRMTGDLAAAAAIQRALIDSLESLPGPPDNARISRIFKSQMYMSEVCLDQGSYRQALYYANSAINTGKAIFEYASADGFILTPHYVLVRTYMLTGDYQGALAELNRILSLIPGVSERQSERRIRTYLDLARLHKRSGTLDSASYYIKLMRDEPAAGQFQISIQRLGAEAHMARQQYDKAVDIYQSLLDSLEASGDYNADIYAELQTDLGDLYMSCLGKPVNALEHFQSAIYALSSVNRDNVVTNNPDLSSLYDQSTLIASLKGKSAALLALSEDTSAVENIDYADAAWQTIDLGLDFIGRMRSGYQTAEDRAVLIEESYLLYETALEYCHAMIVDRASETWVDTAFALMEGSKALNLLDDISHKEARELSGIPDSVIRLELAIRADINQLKKRERDLRKHPDTNQADLRLVLQALQTAEQSMDSLIETFKSDYPDYLDRREESGQITLKQAQSKLHPDESVLEYFMASPATRPFLLTYDKESAKLIFCSGPESALAGIDTVVVSFDETLKDRTATIDNAALLRALYDLHEWLVAPAGILNDHIIVVPDGRLHGVPFAALLTNPAQQTYDLRDQPYLIRDASILYSYSSRLNYTLRQSSVGRGNGASYAFSPEIDTATGFLPLPLSKAEAEQVGARFGADVIVGHSCSKSSVNRILTEQGEFGIMHFATHGLADLQHGADSYLQFSGISDTSRLFAHDLYQQDFEAALVFLSACQTAEGSMQAGEGVVSLARAFFRSGARNLVTTVRNVGDRQAQEITDVFYEQLQMGQRVDVSLAEAQRTYITSLASDERHLAHPAYWSGFVAFGNASRVFSRHSTVLVLLGIAMTVGVLFAYFYRKHFKKG